MASAMGLDSPKKLLAGRSHRIGSIAFEELALRSPALARIAHALSIRRDTGPASGWQRALRTRCPPSRTIESLRPGDLSDAALPLSHDSRVRQRFDDIVCTPKTALAFEKNGHVHDMICMDPFAVARKSPWIVSTLTRACDENLANLSTLIAAMDVEHPDRIMGHLPTVDESMRRVSPDWADLLERRAAFDATKPPPPVCESSAEERYRRALSRLPRGADERAPAEATMLGHIWADAVAARGSSSEVRPTARSAGGVELEMMRLFGKFDDPVDIASRAIASFHERLGALLRSREGRSVTPIVLHYLDRLFWFDQRLREKWMRAVA
ncbi:MAG: hypothetical protein SGPRY_004685 [Prymnesium sp.]